MPRGHLRGCEPGGCSTHTQNTPPNPPNPPAPRGCHQRSVHPRRAPCGDGSGCCPLLPGARGQGVGWAGAPTGAQDTGPGKMRPKYASPEDQLTAGGMKKGSPFTRTGHDCLESSPTATRGYGCPVGGELGRPHYTDWDPRRRPLLLPHRPLGCDPEQKLGARGTRQPRSSKPRGRTEPHPRPSSKPRGRPRKGISISRTLSYGQELQPGASPHLRQHQPCRETRLASLGTPRRESSASPACFSRVGLIARRTRALCRSLGPTSDRAREEL